MKLLFPRLSSLLAICAPPVSLLLWSLVGQPLNAQTVVPSNPLGPLRTAPIAEPPNLSEFVRDRQTAIQLGKALFWDMQVGSDGVTACASCHFNAGADSRAINQLSPGLLRVFADGTANPDNTFTLLKPNQQLLASDFPFRKLKIITDPNSQVLADSNDVASSQGVFATKFVAVVPGSAFESGAAYPDTVYNVGGINVRRVAARNAPSVINAVFNFRNFWDGRAQNDFNGVNPFGSRDPDARVLVAAIGGELSGVRVSLPNSSLASQAVGPPLSHFEMTYEGRTFSDIGDKLGAVRGKKILALRPLGQQLVARDDSVLGSASRNPSPGLRTSYRQLIQAAFHSKWWKSQWVVQIGADGSLTSVYRATGPQSTTEYAMDEYNFALFFGIAVQMYEATLVSDDTPLDRYLAGNTGALSAEQKSGLDLFTGKGRCVNCHGGPELTNASVRNVTSQRLERMLMGDGSQAVYDNGFYNIGVRPTLEDLALGGVDPFGKPLSDTRMAQIGLFTDPKLSPPINQTERAAVDGAFKTPSLRNIALTAPYFHNGGQLTLDQVVDFYDRGGDRTGSARVNSTGFGANKSNLDADVVRLGLTLFEKANLVAFLGALTDERVRYRRAPFDHPQLFVPNGHPWNPANPTGDVLQNTSTGNAQDSFIEIPAVGRYGGTTLKTFQQNLPLSR